MLNNISDEYQYYNYSNDTYALCQLSCNVNAVDDLVSTTDLTYNYIGS